MTNEAVTALPALRQTGVDLIAAEIHRLPATGEGCEPS